MKKSDDPLQDPRFEGILSRLRHLPEPRATAGFDERVLAAVRRSRESRGSHMRVWRRVAAALVLFLGIGFWWLPEKQEQAERTPSPVEILMAAQRTDGRWTAEAGDQPSRYDTGVTALVLLALLHSEGTVPEGPRVAVIQAGMTHLLRQQNPDGRFGPDYSGARFTHYLATKAVESAIRQVGADSAWESARARAQRHLPAEYQMAQLNQHLAQPESFPARWAEVAGPSATLAIQLLKR